MGSNASPSTDPTSAQMSNNYIVVASTNFLSLISSQFTVLNPCVRAQCEEHLREYTL